MGKTLDLGRRIELNPVDPHSADISVAVYEKTHEGSPIFLVHSYSSAEGTQERIDYLRQALIEMAGLEPVPSMSPWIRFPCQKRHERALRRVFLDLCRLDNDAELASKPLEVFDKKANGQLSARGLGQGTYVIEPAAGLAEGARRAKAVARGFNKLCELSPVEGHDDRIAFSCHTDHHALVGALFYRAQNVRAAMQEEEASAARGVLTAPRAQQ